MPRLSKLLEKLEDRIANRWGRWYERNKARVPLYAVLGALGWYFYGMLLNSLKLGKESVFHMSGEEVESIWVLNPFRNLFVVLTPFGLGVTAVIFLLICLITKKGYSWFSGYHFTRDPRGFDILPDGTHGTSGFAKKKELAEHLELGTAQEVTGMLLGRIKERPDDPDKYSTYVAHRMKPGENNNILCIGAPGSYKSRGFIIPFLMGCAQRSNSDGGQHPESVIVTDPKGELFEMTAPYFEKKGFYVKAVNFLDMAHSDGWNCLAGLDTNPDLVTTVANTIIQNTSGPKEADDFWSRAELNLLMALIHYVCNKKDDRGNLLPLEQRSLGDVYKILAYKSVNEINRTLAELPPEHPAKGPHGLFLKARENLWGNIIIGLGNRLAVFQNPLVDKITRNHDVDLLLPGQRPCAYFVIISAQDSAYRFLSSLFFSLTFPQLDPHSIYVWNPETERREKKTMYCAIVVPYRVRIVIPASEMWESGNERPDYVLQNMVGASIDLVIIKVEREAGFAIGSRRLASRSQRYFFAHREDLHRIGSRVKCRMLAVGPRRCLVDCYGHDLDLTQREMRYAAIPDLRDEYHPGME